VSKGARKSADRGPKKVRSRPLYKAAERKAALAYEREKMQRERDQAKQEAAASKERERRRQAVDRAQAALDAGAREHAARTAAIEAERDAVEKMARVEDDRWESRRRKLEAALKRARN
jgi:hypothetical protein